MPKLELKPWKLEEWQVVWESKDGLRRIVVVFDVFGRMVRMQFLDEGKWTTEPANSIEWQEAALDLLGIPETIEEKTAVNEPQPHTIQGQRGQQIITLKDIQIAECFLRGMLDAATYYGKDNDYSPTEKLYYNDLIEIIYEVRWMENFDPVAIVQSACCHMEKVMGIYPNIPPLIEAKMKTCNGCDRLIQQVKIIWDGAYYFVDLCTFEISDNSFDRTFRVIGRHEKTVETPDWCPKKNENIQKEVSNVH